MDAKTKAIVAHITYIGWIIALVININEKDELTSYYIRQLLGIYLFSIVVSFIPVVNLVGWLIAIIFWVMSLVGAINGEIRETPLIGKYFQEWFKGL